MKIDDIYNSSDSNYNKAVKAWQLWGDTEKWLEQQPHEEQLKLEDKIKHTVNMCAIICSNIPMDELHKITKED